jgi:hypothetical protein
MNNIPGNKLKKIVPIKEFYFGTFPTISKIIFGKKVTSDDVVYEI